ncbi:MAG: F420-non-reducing hydrogenase small subunit [Desulfonauticus sp.]|jgi:F420-non-reducing hydrogenase small subunit|nr:F420-non-reducing hydrogenase small subunit [Desulfonauticus sp.]
MADKLKFAFLLAGGCAGCEMSLVDISEKLVDALEHLEVVFWAPTVADVKYKDLEAMPDKSIDLAFVDGMIRNSENEHMVKVLRDKAKILVAFGACATLGSIAGMANMHTKEELFKQAYQDTFSTDNPDGVYPTPEYLLDGKYDLTIPEFLPEVKVIDEVVPVEYYVGGCPPHPDFVAAAVEAVIAGNLPPAGSWLTSGKAVCDVCERNPRNQGTDRFLVEEVYRTSEKAPEDGVCLLQQGIICFGPFTQGDCGCSCPKVGIPCRGCGGPIPGVKDYGARAMSAIGSILGSEEAVEQLMQKYPVLAKFYYRYSLPSSLIERKKRAIKKG